LSYGAIGQQPDRDMSRNPIDVESVNSASGREAKTSRRFLYPAGG